ncbi:MAG TPA: DUF4395 family protein, partial [Marmoricola sp.]|nr:DUF4395 family protein [Marmoricola sp.]
LFSLPAAIGEFALVGLGGYLFSAPLVGAVAVGFALVAALLNAIFNFCLGCEVYLLLRRAGVPLPLQTN